jgi:EAL domain-containing protein (putative c-di-GMP-specific phosphodiesterase class I)
VIFEITETAAIANIAKARDFSEQLMRLGCRFALDDFGAGFGSFYYLKHVRFDVLKIDGEFVRDCCASPTDRLVIQAVVGIARGLGKQTVAEHVGDAQTVRMGVNGGQGFYLARPLPLGEFLSDLSSAGSYGPLIGPASRGAGHSSAV